MGARSLALLAALAASLRVGGVLSSANSSFWMHDVYERAELANKTVLDLTLPGTHDACTFNLTDHFAPGTSDVLDAIVDIADKLGLDEFPLIWSWATAQNLTLTEQLLLGARYIDMRAVYSTPTELDPATPTGWHTEHMVLGLPTAELLDQVAAFLRVAPGGEIVVIELTHLYGSNATTQEELRQLCRAKLGPWLIDDMPYNSTIEALTKGNTVNRVLILMESWNGPGIGTGIWPDSIIQGEYANKDNVAEMSEHDQGLIETLGGDGEHIFRLWWTLTEQPDDVVIGVLDPNATQSLKELSHKANVELRPWYEANRNYTLGNLLVVDWIETTPAVDIAVEEALRNCLDDAAYRARSPNGQDCRSWGIAGDCAGSSTHSQFVRAHCPRTCLQC